MIVVGEAGSSRGLLQGEWAGPAEPSPSGQRATGKAAGLDQETGGLGAD